MKDILQIIEECEKNNVSFYSVSEHLGIDTDMNKLMLNIMGSLGEYERTILRIIFVLVRQTRPVKVNQLVDNHLMDMTVLMAF